MFTVKHAEKNEKKTGKLPELPKPSVNSICFSLVQQASLRLSDSPATRRVKAAGPWSQKLRRFRKAQRNNTTKNRASVRNETK